MFGIGWKNRRIIGSASAYCLGHHRRTARVQLVITAVLAVVACGDEQGAGVPIRASDGIAIVQDTGFVLASSQLAQHDIVLHRVRSAAFVGVDRILVGLGDPVGPALFLMDTSGNLLASAGRHGDGPDEFRYLGAIHSDGDNTFAVWDLRGRRLAIGSVESGGTFGIDSTLQSDRDLVPIGFGGGESMFLQVPHHIVSPGDPMTLGVVDLATGNLNRWQEEGLTHSSSERITLRGGTDGSVTFGITFPNGCIPRPLATAFDAGVIVALPASGEVYLANSDAAPRPLYRTEDPPLFTEEMASYLRRYLTAVTSGGDGVAPDGSTYERSTPDISRAFVDSVVASIGIVGQPYGVTWDDIAIDRITRRIWLRRATCLQEGSVSEWDVIDMNGSSIGRVELPLRHRILAVGGPHAVIMYADSMDVEHIQLWSMGR